jgi:cytochrome c biogenesis protein CcmG, thiol:disulfide interchange protein DsbE
VARGTRKGPPHPPVARLLAAILALSCAGLGVAGAAAPSRFIPWTQPHTPALALKNTAGQPQTLADYKGKVVLLNFWATWCEPCRDEMASMRTLRERLAGQPFDIVTVNYGESEAKVTAFFKTTGFDFPALLDPNQEAPKAWRVRVLPSSFLVGRDGRVRYSVIGEIDWAGEEAMKTVRMLLP